MNPAKMLTSKEVGEVFLSNSLSCQGMEDCQDDVPAASQGLMKLSWGNLG